MTATSPLPGPHLHDFHAGDLPLEGGGCIEDFYMRYATHGVLNAERSNAILVCTAIGANHSRLDFLIGPGQALDTNRYFVITTNAIGNGLTTSPSNSRSQPRLAFPRYSIRDMVESQHRLLRQALGLDRLHAVVGVSMGGMQALQWGVSHPGFMDAIVALVPLVRTPAWTRALLALIRQQVMADPAWAEGQYGEPPEAGMRLWAGTMALITRTPQFVEHTEAAVADASGWLRRVQEETWKNIDALDWVYQSHAYESHDLGATPGFHGDAVRALQAIRARTLLLSGTGDLLNPQEQVADAARFIPNALHRVLEPRFPAGHFIASGKTAPEAEALNQAIGEFLSALQAVPAAAAAR